MSYCLKNEKDIKLVWPRALDNPKCFTLNQENKNYLDKDDWTKG